MSQHEEGAEGQVEETASAAEQTEGPAVGAGDEPVATQEDADTQDDGTTQDEGGGKGKAAAVAAGTGAAVAGIAGGIAVAARDTRRRVLGVPLGKRGRFQRAASTVVDKAQEPVRKLGSRFSRD